MNGQGAKSQWWYTTMFDGKDEKLAGNPGTDSGSVRPLSDRVNEIKTTGVTFATYEKIQEH